MRLYIAKSTYGGLDYHDATESLDILKWDGSYFVPQTKVIDCIASDIMRQFAYLDCEKIYEALLRKQKYTFPILQPEDNGHVPDKYCGHWMYEGCIDGDELVLFEDYFQVFYTTCYYLNDIPENDVCYIVEEHFMGCGKGVPLIQRFYHEPFKDLESAGKYKANFKLHDWPCFKTETKIIVYQESKLKNNEWYQNNMEIIRLLKEADDKEIPFSAYADIQLARLKNQKN